MRNLNANDLIQLKTTENVRFLSSTPGKAVSPQGNWVITGFVGSDVIACKDGAVVRIPASDVRKVGGYSIEQLMEALKKAGAKKNEIDMTACISDAMGWQADRARRFLLRFNLPLYAQSEQQKLQIIHRVERLAEDYGE